MDGDERYWLSLWSIVAVAVLISLIAALVYNDRKGEKFKDMVKAGADPVALACAQGEIDRNAPICFTQVMRSTEKVEKKD